MSKNGGVIINISTTLPHCGVALQSHAGTAKAGVDALTRHLAVELGPKKIRVVGIAPGAIEKSEGFKRLRMDDSVYLLVM
jgi:peroxisomal 2,4-dienoyl-CoA reductase